MIAGGKMSQILTRLFLILPQAIYQSQVSSVLQLEIICFVQKERRFRNNRPNTA